MKKHKLVVIAVVAVCTLTVRVIHPAINGKTETTYTLDVPIGATHGAFHSIDTEAEPVAGEWVIQIEHGGEVLAREEFTLGTQSEVSP